MAKITLIGFYNYDSTLFDNLTVNAEIDKETLVNNILLRGGEFEVLESNPDYIKLKMAVWSKKWKSTIDKWVMALNLEFNPIENYDRIEEWNDTSNSVGTSAGSTTANDNGTVENKVSAFDSTSYQPKDENISNNTTQSNSNVNTSADDNSHHTGRVHGNIGVTTSSALLGEFLEIAKWNLIDNITDLFLTEFVIPVY